MIFVTCQFCGGATTARLWDYHGERVLGYWCACTRYPVRIARFARIAYGGRSVDKSAKT